jgi:hypothetical protein
MMVETKTPASASFFSLARADEIARSVLSSDALPHVARILEEDREWGHRAWVNGDYEAALSHYRTLYIMRKFDMGNI